MRWLRDKATVRYPLTDSVNTGFTQEKNPRLTALRCSGVPPLGFEPATGTGFDAGFGVGVGGGSAAASEKAKPMEVVGVTVGDGEAVTVSLTRGFSGSDCARTIITTAPTAETTMAEATITCVRNAGTETTPDAAEQQRGIVGDGCASLGVGHQGPRVVTNASGLLA